MSSGAAGFLKVFVAILLGVPLVAILAGLYRMGLSTQLGYARTICEFADFKRDLAMTRPHGPRVVFFGFSNVLNGIRSDVAAEALGRDVVNLGMIANLTNGVVFDILRRSLEADDTAVLVLPYFFMTADTRIEGQVEVVRETILDCSRRGLWRLPVRYWPGMLLLQHPARTWEGVKRRFEAQTGIDLGVNRLPPTGMFTTRDRGGAFSPRGDWLLNDGATRAPDYRERLLDAARSPSAWPLRENGDGLRQLRGFIADARRDGIRVVAAWPSVYLRDRDGLGALAASIRAYYAREGVTVVGDPEAAALPVESFHDSPNHLTDEAARAYTARLAHDLGPVLDGRAPAVP